MDRRTAVTGLVALAFAGAGRFALPALAQEAGEAKALAAKLLAAAPSLGERSLGRIDAPVVMVEYGSATCEHSAEFNQNVWPELRRDYVESGKMRFIFRELPLDNLALGAFILVRSLPEDKFFPILDLLFARQKLWRTATPKEEMFRIMQQAGMDRATFESSIRRNDIAKAIFEAGKAAQAEFGIRKTPAIYVNGRVIAGHEAVAEFKTAIESELAV
ncbi:MAG: DsbA family protein [Rhizobiales bacterium]|nr:DsbA family protein [Hyphomicrobiales bacterium]MBI3672515.1 DsbA family protein [Hyphomicrobiales bacterium]